MKVTLTENEVVKESAVGSRGRTGKVDAEAFIKDNPELANKFKKIVSQIGGKAVATALLNLKLWGKGPDPEKMAPTIYYKLVKDAATED